MSNLYKYFKKLDEENKIGQAFLIGNVSFDEIEEELYKVLNDFFFKNSKNIHNNPDLYVLKQNKNLITKAEIKELLLNLSVTSQFNNVKVYVIENCEKMTDTVSNALLKTLEEPEKGIYAFLLTSNMNSVKSTISSRCSKIFILSNSIKSTDVTDYQTAFNLINMIEKLNIELIVNNSELYSIINDRNRFINILENMLVIYRESLNIIINSKINEDYFEIIKNNTSEQISKKIVLICNTIELLNHNLNKNLSIDRFIIDMWRCKNEKSIYTI